MDKKFITLLLMVLVVCAMLAQTQGPFHVVYQRSGVPPGTANNSSPTLASTAALTAAFVFSGGAAANYVNSTGCFANAAGVASCTTGFSPVNGHSLIVWAVENNPQSSAALTCSDGEGTGNTYTRDVDNNTGGGGQRAGFFHASGISGSGTYTVTCAGTGTGGGSFWQLIIFEVDKASLSLASVSAGSNPSSNSFTTVTNISTAGFTTTDANVFLISAMADNGGSNLGPITLQGTGFTKGPEAANGATAYIGSSAYQTVTSTGAYADGFTLSANATGLTYTLIGYK